MKIIRPISFLLLFIIFMKMGTAFCQDVIFNKVNPPKGKSFTHVRGIVQDLNGYMWFATKTGLFSYDGSRMLYYKHESLDPNSLSSNSLECICLDSAGMIWIGTTDGGLERFDPVNKTFKHFRHNDNDAGSLLADYVDALLTDHEGVLWVGTGMGLDRYDEQTGTFRHFVKVPEDTSSLSCNEVVSLYEDRQGVLWVGTGSVYVSSDGPEIGGLNRMDKDKGTFTRYMHNPRDPNSLADNKVGAMYEDSRGTFWVGCSGSEGLQTMDREKGTFTQFPFDPAHPDKLCRPPISKDYPETDFITFIIGDADGNLWIGTSESGMNCYDPRSEKTRHFESGREDLGEYSDRTTWAAYISKDGILWISSLRESLYRAFPVRKEIQFYTVPSYRINCIYEFPDKTLWLGTEHGLLQEEVRDGIRRYAYPVIPNSTLNTDYIAFITRDESSGNVWIGGSGGLILTNEKRENLVSYDSTFWNKANTNINGVISMYKNEDGSFWIGSLRGLYFLDPRSGSNSHYFLDEQDTSKAFGKNTCTSILRDHTGKLWIGCWAGGGLYQYTAGTGIERKYMEESTISCIYEDRNKELWVGTGDGLLRYERGPDKFVKFEIPGSFVDVSEVNDICEDRLGNLWVTTPHGIVRLDPQRTGIRLFDSKYGLQGDDAEYFSIKEYDGELFVGGTEGYYRFLPSDLEKPFNTPHVDLEGIRLADQAQDKWNSGTDGKGFHNLDELQLRSDQNSFSIDFNTIDFAYPEENQTIFMLENYDLNWREAGSDHKSYYFNVPPGKYTFRVKGVNGFGITAEKRIALVILPPWWRSWWAYILYAIILAGGIFAVDRFQRRRLLLAEKEKARKRELAQAKEIEKAYEQLKSTQTQLVHAEKMASLGELTAGIAHEIQNPLNFVNNFSEVNSELIEELKEELTVDGQRSAVGGQQPVMEILEDIRQNMQKISHHGKRADAIVKGMLQHSRSSSNSKEPTDINALADQYLRLSYHGLRAKDKSFNSDFTLEQDPSLPMVNVVPQDIGRVFLNLINNAFYAVDKKRQAIMLEPQNIAAQQYGYQPTVTVTTKNLAGKVEIRVKDNGDGIPAGLLDKIFQPFFTTKPTGEGTGLGLSLSYDIIKAHGGELKVETREGEGTEFIICLNTNVNT